MPLAYTLGYTTEPTDKQTLAALCEQLIERTNDAAEKTKRDGNNRMVLSGTNSDIFQAGCQGLVSPGRAGTHPVHFPLRPSKGSNRFQSNVLYSDYRCVFSLHHGAECERVHYIGYAALHRCP